MARINLLPWRETLRKKRQRDFGSAAILALIVTGVACGAVHFYISELISFQEQRNAYLQNEIKALDKKIAEIRELEKVKAQLIARMNVIQSLQSSRPLVVHLFDELVETLPEGAYISDMTQSGNRITINGKAQSNARVSSYMRNIDKSLWLRAPDLQVISSGSTDGTQLNSFTLTAAQVVKKEGDE